MLPQQKTGFIEDTSHSGASVSPSDSRPGFHSRSKRTVGLFLLFTLILAALMALLIIVVDPLQFYHRTSWYTPVYSKQERYQNPGLAKNFDYDTIIIGTSMTENFLPSEVGESLGGTAMKLSIEGSTVEEHYKMARLALETGKVKKVLWGLDYFSLKNPTPEEQQSFPDFLYDDKISNDYKYIFNSSVYTQFFLSLKSSLLGNHTELEHLNNWNDTSTFSKERVAKDYGDHSASEIYFGMNEEGLPELQERFNTYIDQLLTDYPDVEFNFYYPPYSIMRQVAWYNVNPKRYSNQLEMRKWMFSQINKHPNSRLYDFQSESDWTFNLDLYKDLSHHSGQVNSWIAQAVGRDDAKYRVTEDNISLLNNNLESQTHSALMDKKGNVYAYEVTVNNANVPFTTRLVQEQGELFLPAKEVAASLGATLQWDSAAKQAVFTIKQHTLQMTAGQSKAEIDGQAVTMLHPILISGGRAMVPVQFVAEQLGLKADLNIDQHEYQLSISE
ncbi:copper amine oxidase N-terminal domain-containing protein [Paenibacillus sp. sgz500958]|uniref:copper amine oxidase N-terminal domain-containing protein n=1 Tax=Paenibacillus sp. sgz500958 TaxID=3242475 RepID=UPI0036D35D12